MQKLIVATGGLSSVPAAPAVVMDSLGRHEELGDPLHETSRSLARGGVVRSLSTGRL